MRQTPAGALSDFLAAFVDSHPKAAANTVRNWRNSAGKLCDFLGPDRDLRTIKPKDADGWRAWLEAKDYSDSTISKATKHAKQFFKRAVRDGLAEENPSDHLKACGESNAERKEYVTPETIARVLDACPDAEWRLIVALARFGGLRVPSELLALEWDHVNWAEGRFTVPCQKTKRLGKPYRVVPIFSELRPYLDEAWEAAGESRYLIQRYRQQNANLRTRLERIIRRAGVKPWGRLFHNLRASRQSELSAQYPAHVVCDWLGNTAEVADLHYLSTLEEHFQNAQGVDHHVDHFRSKVDQQVDLQATATDCGNRQEVLPGKALGAKTSGKPHVLCERIAPPRGIESGAKTNGETAILRSVGATVGATDATEHQTYCPDHASLAYSCRHLSRLLAAWDRLDDQQRALVVSLAESLQG